MTAYLAEKNQRRSFLEIKESIIGNAFIEEQLLEQVKPLSHFQTILPSPQLFSLSNQEYSVTDH